MSFPLLKPRCAAPAYGSTRCENPECKSHNANQPGQPVQWFEPQYTRESIDDGRFFADEVLVLDDGFGVKKYGQAGNDCPQIMTHESESAAYQKDGLIHDWAQAEQRSASQPAVHEASRSSTSGMRISASAV